MTEKILPIRRARGFRDVLHYAPAVTPPPLHPIGARASSDEAEAETAKGPTPETQTSRASGGHGRGSRGTARRHCLGRAGAGRPPVRARSGGDGEGLRWASGVL